MKYTVDSKAKSIQEGTKTYKRIGDQIKVEMYHLTKGYLETGFRDQCKTT